MVESTPTVDRKKDELRRIQEKSNRETSEEKTEPAADTPEDSLAFTITF